MVIKYFERIGIPLTNPSDDHIVQLVPDLSNTQSGQADPPTDADQLPADEQLGDNIIAMFANGNRLTVPIRVRLGLREREMNLRTTSSTTN